MSTVQEVSSLPAATPVPVLTGENKEPAIKQTVSVGGDATSIVSLPPPVTPSLQTHYEELLRVIAEVGKDVKPAYTNSKISADRLKRNIALARTTLRDCLLDIERLNQIHSQK